MSSYLVSSSVCPSESRGKTCHESSPGASYTKSQGRGGFSLGGNLSRGGRMRAVFWSQSPMKRKKLAVGKCSQAQMSRRSPAGCALAQAQANTSKGQYPGD